MNAIHLICRRDDGVNLNRVLLLDRATFSYRSGTWDLDAGEAQALVGGWLYLHPSKNKPSEFGGHISGFEVVQVDGLARETRIDFIFKASPSARGTAWRGQSHGMAWTGGIVPAGLPHERDRSLGA